MKYEMHIIEDFKRVLFLYNVGELKYQIANTAFSQGDVARVHDNYGHDLLGDRGENYMHQWKDICEDGNWDRVKRSIELAIGDVEQILYKMTCTVLPMHGLSMDNVEEHERLEYGIELKVVLDFSATTAEYMMNLINEYIIDYVLEDWAAITFPEAMATWGAKKQLTADRLRHASHYRMLKPSVAPSFI